MPLVGAMGEKSGKNKMVALQILSSSILDFLLAKDEEWS
jgi:hypothetical protein